ncbi:MAG: SixA phosphatase family protein [Myxococcota bacterium]
MFTWIHSVLTRAPSTVPIVVLMRHAAREPMATGLPDADLPLTEQGRQSAHALGGRLAPHLHSIRSSPIRRCRETASELLAGAGLALECPSDTLLGDPGVFIRDAVQAWPTFTTYSMSELIDALLVPGRRLPGMEEGEVAVTRLLNHLFALSRGSRGLHLAITHDYLVTVTALQVLGLTPHPSRYADFLEPLALWYHDQHLWGYYQASCQRCEVEGLSITP